MTIKTKKNILARRAITPANREAIDEIKHAMTLHVRLHELRERRSVIQTAVAEQIGTRHPNVSRIEAEDDIRVTTLARYVRALGGRLEVRAVFDDEVVNLTDETNEAT